MKKFKKFEIKNSLKNLRGGGIAGSDSVQPSGIAGSDIVSGIAGSD